ncbi:MAG: metal-dependent transcriptional regulator [Bifidobacteriaceae bacterium]|jgi:DtxR family Mn-dependent transcriptional regulator|nr:metal-dependent transcriptional regulator [Bifidobacteriaceae bacterium]
MKRFASAAAEDYLKVIWSLGEWSNQDPVTTSVLAARMEVSPSTASEAIKRLAERGLVSHDPYAAIELTETGERVALGMVRRHRLLETLLVEKLGYQWDEAHADAEILEHAASDRFIDAVDQLLGHPDRDPHGDPIPGPDGSVTHPAAEPLSSLTASTQAVIRRISDAEPAMLRYFASVGLIPDAAITVLERRDFAGVIVLQIDSTQTQVELGDIAAAAIWAAPL